MSHFNPHIFKRKLHILAPPPARKWTVGKTVLIQLFFNWALRVHCWDVCQNNYWIKIGFNPFSVCRKETNGRDTFIRLSYHANLNFPIVPSIEFSIFLFVWCDYNDLPNRPYYQFLINLILIESFFLSCLTKLKQLEKYKTIKSTSIRSSFLLLPIFTLVNSGTVDSWWMAFGTMKIVALTYWHFTVIFVLTDESGDENEIVINKLFVIINFSLYLK